MTRAFGTRGNRWLPWTRWATAVSLAALLAGCGGKDPLSAAFYPVKGKVTLPDGKPLPDVEVIFSGPVTGHAITDGDGNFAFKGEKEGLPEGVYQVHLEVVRAKVSGKKVVPTFPPKYGDEDTSGLTAKVTAAGPNEFNFPLTKGDAESSPRAARGAGKGRA
jgi:hypothetical protein